MDQPVRDLTTAIAAGDTAAFARFYESWFDFMFEEAKRISGRDESYCLDVVQDGMLRVIRSLKPLETEAALRKWLRLTVRSCVYDRFRQETRRRRREETRPARHAPARHAPPAVTAPDDELAERLDWLRGELRDQDDTVSTLLLMRHGLGWTLERIGAALGLKTGAVDGRIRRAMDGLGRRAKEEFDE